MPFLWAALVAESARRPAGYLDAIQAAGERRGNRLWISPDDAGQIRRRFPPAAAAFLPPLPRVGPPSLRVQIRTLLFALWGWLRGGFRLASWPVIRARRRACLTCPWRQGRLVPRCGLCGCTDLKLFLPASNCPATPPRWPS